MAFEYQQIACKKNSRMLCKAMDFLITGIGSSTNRRSHTNQLIKMKKRKYRQQKIEKESKNAIKQKKNTDCFLEKKQQLSVFRERIRWAYSSLPF